MAISYWLQMISDLSCHQAMRLLAERLGVSQSDEGFLCNSGISISGADVQPGRWTEVAEEAFHFTPNLKMGFRRPADANGEEFDRLVLRAAMLLLENGREAVLLFNSERIIFQRLGGQLVFNSDRDVALDESIIKQEVHVSYERRSLPSPLL